MAKLSNEAIAYQFFVGMQLKENYKRFGVNVTQKDVDKYLEFREKKRGSSKYYRIEEYLKVVFPDLNGDFPDLMILKDAPGDYHLFPVSKKQDPLQTFAVDRNKINFNKIIKI